MAEVDDWIAPASGGGPNDWVAPAPLKSEPSDKDMRELSALSNVPTVSRTDAALRGAAQGLSFGFGDEIQGASAATQDIAPVFASVPVFGRAALPLVGAGRVLFEKVMGRRGSATEAYERARDEARTANRIAETDHPGLYHAGEAAGVVASALIPGVPALQGATRFGTAARSSALGAGMGALQGAGEANDLADVPREALTGAGIGAVVGAGAPAVTNAIGRTVSRVISPVVGTPERQALVDNLRREGVELTAGQASGSRPLRWMESALGDMPMAGGRPAEVMNRQGQQFTSAALRRAGIDAPLATPDVLQAGAQRLGQVFDDLSARNTLHLDRPFAQDIGRVINEYDRVLPSQQRNAVAAYIDDLIRLAPDIPGTVYQDARSRLSRQAHAIRNSDPAFAGALRGIRDALDNAMGRSVSPQDRAAWREAQRQWGHLRTIEQAMSGAGERAAEGYLSPALLRSAVATRNRSQYARGLGSDLVELARSGTVMNPLPQSGTAPRAYMQGLTMALGGLGGGAATGDWTGVAGGVLGPAAAGRVLMSRPVQAYLRNRIATGPLPGNVQGAGAAALSAIARARAISERERDRLPKPE